MVRINLKFSGSQKIKVIHMFMECKIKPLSQFLEIPHYTSGQWFIVACKTMHELSL